MKCILFFAVVGALHASGQIAAQSTAAALFQNILWAGIPNPVDITSVNGFSDVHVVGGTVSQMDFSGNRHAQLLILPDPGAASVSCTMKREDGSVHSAAVFQVNPLPAPVIAMGLVNTGDTLSIGELAQLQFTAELEHLEIDIPFEWKGFQLSTFSGGRVVTFASDDQHLTPEMLRGLEALPSGTQLLFSSVEVGTPDGVTHRAPNFLVYKR